MAQGAGQQPRTDGVGAEAGVPPITAAAPAEIAASTLVNVLGKDFIVENSKDFFKLVKTMNEEEKLKNGKHSLLVESIKRIFADKEEKPHTRNQNVEKQFIVNEFGGLIFESNGNKKRAMTLYESYKSKHKGDEDYVTRYRKKKILIETATQQSVLS